MDIKYLKGVGDKRAEAFNKIGINKLEDFLQFIPRTYCVGAFPSRRGCVKTPKKDVGILEKGLTSISGA